MKNINAEGKWRRINTSPYFLQDSCRILWHNLTGPVKNTLPLQWVAQDDVWCAETKSKVSCLFLGDFLSLQDVDLDFDDQLYCLAKDSDYVVVNLEGNVSASGQWSLFHQYNVLEKFLSITRLKPACNIIVSVANNHSADYGAAGIEANMAVLDELGFLVVGVKGRESICLAEGVFLHAATMWSNQSTAMLATLPDARPIDKAFNILYPHWGYELELYPRQEQVRQAEILLGRWDMVIGHHAHVPQAIVKYTQGLKSKLVAYSLGDFACQFKRSHYRHGMVIRAELAEDSDGAVVIRHVEWYFSYCDFVAKGQLLVRLKKHCRYFSAFS